MRVMPFEPFWRQNSNATFFGDFQFVSFHFRSMTSKEVQKSSSLQLEVQLTKIFEPSQCNPVSV